MGFFFCLLSLLLFQHLASDPILAATDVASTVQDDQESAAIDINIPSTPVTDQMFDMIIGGTPETSFISEYMEQRKMMTSTPDGTKENNRDSETSSAQHTHNTNTTETKNRHSFDHLSSRLSTKCHSGDDRDVSDMTLTTQDSNNDNNSVDMKSPTINSQLEASHTSTNTNTSTNNTTSMNNSYMRECSIDSMSNSMTEGSMEYNRIFSDIVPAADERFTILLPPSGIVGGSSTVTSPTSPHSSTTNVEVSNEVSELWSK